MNRIAQSIYGEEIDLDKLIVMSGWKGEGDKITIFSKDGNEILAIVPVDMLITCWIEKEEQDYNEAHKEDD